ncbi:MAG: Uma2 family endonuclease [Stellaceae bacterium]
MSLDEFLAWEREQPERYEFDGLVARMMTGGSLDHSTIASNLWTTLREKLRGTGCMPFRGDAKVVANRNVRYPDLSITCSPTSGSDDIVPAPVVIVEILSPSSEREDRGRKNSITSPHRRSANTRSSSRTSGGLSSTPAPRPPGSTKSSPATRC